MAELILGNKWDERRVSKELQKELEH